MPHGRAFPNGLHLWGENLAASYQLLCAGHCAYCSKMLFLNRIFEGISAGNGCFFHDVFAALLLEMLGLWFRGFSVP